MSGALVLAMTAAVCGQGRGSMLGAEKPWWEALKAGDVVRFQAPAGAEIPMARLFDYGEAEGSGRTGVHIATFADAASHGRWAEVHAMVDRGEVNHLRFGWARVYAVRPDPTLGVPVAEVVVCQIEAHARALPAEIPPETLGTYAVPVPYLCGHDQARHPAAGRLPVLVRRAACGDDDCGRMDAVPLAEFERARAPKAVARR